MQRHTPEAILAKLRRAEADLARGRSVAAVCRKLAISEQTFYRWRQQFGPSHSAAGHRLRELQAENARLKRQLAEATLHRDMLQQLAQKKW